MPKSATPSLGIVAPAPIPIAQRSGPHRGERNRLLEGRRTLRDAISLPL